MARSAAEGPSTEVQSINRWASAASDLGGQTSKFFAELLREEAGKTRRLDHLADAIGLPVYRQHEFKLPDELNLAIAAVEQITASGDWRLAFKLSNADGRVVFRRLGLGALAACQILNEEVNSSKVQLSPYRDPDLSGTIWKREDVILLELSRGPHFWLTKWAPADQQVVRLRASATDRRLRLEGCGEFERAPFARLAQSACRAILGSDCGTSVELTINVYAEFHWFRSGGLRFIECSFSGAWVNNGNEK